jgi:hypothetical protein
MRKSDRYRGVKQTRDAGCGPRNLEMHWPRLALVLLVGSTPATQWVSLLRVAGLEILTE